MNVIFVAIGAVVAIAILAWVLVVHFKLGAHSAKLSTLETMLHALLNKVEGKPVATPPPVTVPAPAATTTQPPVTANTQNPAA